MSISRTSIAFLAPLLCCLASIPTQAATEGGTVSDLAISVTDNQAITVTDARIVYVITVENLGPDDALGATVSDSFPATVLDVTWTCEATASSSCTASGSGDISESVDLANGGSVTFTARGVVDSFPGTISNTATVAPPAGATDPNSGNDSATDDTDVDTGEVLVNVDLSGPSAAHFTPTAAASAMDVVESSFNGVTLLGFFIGNETEIDDLVSCGGLDVLLQDGGGERGRLDQIFISNFGGGWTPQDVNFYNQPQFDMDFSTVAPAFTFGVTQDLVGYGGPPVVGDTGALITGTPDVPTLLGRWLVVDGGGSTFCDIFADGFESGDTTAWSTTIN